MREHPTSHQLELYRSRTLPPDLFLTVHRHVNACPSCSEQGDARPALKQDYANLLAALMPEPGEEPYHLTRAELSGYVARRLDAVDAESAASHLSVCAECAEAARGLRAGAERVRPGLARPLAPFLAWRRPVLYASLALFAMAIILTAMFVRRAGDGRPAPPATEQAASAPPNSHPDETATPGAGAQNGGEIKSGQAPGGAADAGGAQRASGPELELDDAIAAMLQPSSRRAVASALTEQRLEVSPVLAQLRVEGGPLRGGTGDGRSFSPLTPVGKVVETASPTFRWTPLAGASSYVVAVADDKLDEVASSGTLTETEWSPPSPLKRGAIYSWQVTALKDGQAVTSPELPAPQAKFMVLDRARSEELERVRAAAPRDHLALGVLYARAGLLEEAEAELRALVKSHPGSETAKRLLQSLRSTMRF